MVEPKIRKATEKDLKKISKIYAKEYSKKPYNEKWTDERVIKRIKDYFKNDYIYVAEIDKKVVGFVIFSTFLWWKGKTGFADEIVVSKDYQHKGVGKMLVQKMEKTFKSLGVKSIWAMAHKKAPAFNIHKKTGFKELDYVMILKELK